MYVSSISGAVDQAAVAPSGREPRNEVEVSRADARGRWEPMSIRCLGRITDIVRGGGGKLSVIGGDPGDVRKPVAQQ